MKKEIIVCDGCGTELKKESDIYHLLLKTDEFWDGVESAPNIECLDFCHSCTLSIKKTLEKLSKNLR